MTIVSENKKWENEDIEACEDNVTDLTQFMRCDFDNFLYGYLS